MVNFDQFVSLGEIFTTDCLPEDEGVPKGRTFNLAVLVKVPACLCPSISSV